MTSVDFAGLGVSDRVRAALDARGITSPFPVQAMVIPTALTGRDVLVSSPTGSGKTLAFGLPIIERLEPGGAQPSALVLAPTRELAVQIDEELAPLATAAGLRMAVCYGGVNLETQAKKAARADILIATPGRLLDLARQRRVSLKGIRILVLDEADRMLDMGFLPQVEAIVRQTPRERHTMFFSATLEGAVGSVADGFTRDAERMRMRDSSVADGEKLSERLEQSFRACTASTRSDELMSLIEGEDGLTLVFCRTRRGAGRLAERLEKAGVSAAAMHGDLTQAAREKALKRFASGRARVLVATDVAARGIDLDDIGLVVNFDPPEDQDAYTHRVGRTARAGRTGRAVTLVTPTDADGMARIAANMGLEERWAETGYPMAPPRVVYGSRRRGSAFAPPARPRSRPAAPQGDPATPRRNRVKRGSRRPVA
ncbi:DEAD/DEAH box helicase [Miltoncostaea marina]|uniref:DEAD/DEAH box helicase n=1 Tax=Miltoncostaea marina TaxID=2843215 RepID=UPI001C3CD981|nr:DEAD/DEAH box helicase [Miltoncostaea marina]